MIRALLVLACVGAIAVAQHSPITNDADLVSPFEELIKSGRLEEAQSALRTYTDQHSDSWRAQYQLGYVDFRLHQIQSSVVHLCKSLLLHDGFAEAHKILAYDLNILGHPDRAIIELERSIKIDPSLAESHYELGRIFYERGEYLQAIDHLEQAKKLAPDSVHVYHNLGLSYAAVSENKKAVESFEEGLRRNRQQARPSAWPLIDYGTYLNQRNHFERARTMLLEATALDHQWDQAFDELSRADRGLGRLTESIDALQHAITINGKKPEYHYMLAQLYKQAQRSTESAEELALYRKVRSETQEK